MRLRLNLIILFTIITLIFFNILSVNASSSQMIGDVDKNGKINIIDVRLLLQKVINQNYQEEEAKILDYNRDDDVSIIDVRLLLQDVINGKFDDEIIPKETVQSVIQEVADAYYYRGINAQYSAPRKTEKIAPEEATSQHKIYSTCSTLIFSVYYQSFGIELPINTNNLLAYAKGVYNANDKTNDVVEYWEKGENGYVDNKGNSKEIDLYTEQGIEKYGAELLKTLQIGDIIVFRYIGGGYHAVMVYDYVYNEEGEIIDVVLRESTSHYEKESTKINGGLSYLDILNENNNVQEGTYRELNLINEVKINKDNPTNGIGTRGSYLKKSIAYQTNKEPQCKYFAVIRPLLQNEEGNYTGKYYLASTTQDASEELGYRYDSRKIQEFSISDIALQRANYSKIYIEKTVNYFNNSVIEVGNTLTYTIKIKNNSEQTYDSFEIIENIPEEVEVKSAAGGTINENKITWKVASLNAGEEIEKKYSVIIKSGTPLGSKIISTGTVAGIPSSTITNFVSSNLTTEQKQAIAKTAKTEIDANYKGKELIAKIYEDTFGVDVNLDSFNLEDLVRIKNGTVYYPENDSRANIFLNKDNAFYQMVLSNYYGALYTNSNGNASLKYWSNSFGDDRDSRSPRADTIYLDHFQTGDILIYKNTQTANGNVSYETEDGTYYLMFFKGKINVNGQSLTGFIGIDEMGNVKNITQDNTKLQALLGKDCYVVLRPSMMHTISTIKQVR